MTDNKRFRVLRNATILAVVLLVVTVIWVMAADPPNTISYQGYLTDASGNAIDGSPDMQVVLYTVDTGGTGVYTETHSTVTVTDGQFNLQLGTGTTSDNWANDVDFSLALWMEITIDPSGMPETLSPRIPLSTVPHARYAHSIADDSVTANKLSGISTDGTSGQVVTSNGFGGFSWADGGDITAVNTNAGSGLTGGATTGAATLNVNVDDATIEIAGNAVQVKNSGITSNQITNDTIVNADINSSAAIDFSKLASLTSAQILVGNGSNVPTAVAVGGDATLANTGALSLSTDGRHTRTINATAKTGAYTLTSSDGIILANTSGSAFTFTLPTASGIGGRTYTIKLATAGNTLTIDGNLSETIDGSANTTLSTAGEAVTIASDGTNWRTVSDRSISSGGVGSTVESSEITDDEIVNADINSNANIDPDKLAFMNSGRILVGDGSNGPAAVSMTGDATLASGGALTIQTDAVATAEILNNTVTADDLSATLTFADGDKIDLSAITGVNSTDEGLFLPSYAGTPSSATSEGQITWDSTNDKLYVGDSSGVTEIGSGGGGGIVATTGHLSSVPTTTPNVSTNCTNGALAAGSNDMYGTVSFSGYSATSGCQVTFGTAFDSAPVCVVAGASMAASKIGDSDFTTPLITSSSTSSFTFNMGGSTGNGLGFVSGDKVNYICLGK